MTVPETPPGGDAPRDQRRPGVEAALFAALGRLIEQGAVPSEIPVGRLSREAGISRATFYLYFADRRAFNLRLVLHGWELLTQPLQHLWEAVISGERTVEAALYELMRVYRDNAAVMAAVMDAGTTDPEVAESITTQMGALIDATTAALEHGQRAGTIRDVPARETASVLVWMAERACSQLGSTADDDRLRRLARAMAQLSRDGVVVDR
ncbi:TetR/AcrR family transcriptional regulator [Rhodococcus sp. IEGM 1408]|uniref:TetR/AcrR family transcriptional regulator n=1 Tax=Rhodococcus sp. IEGM 1408 TaxID=3082220 RepID=UPI002955745B|nr:TetR/AcrR family transcriptional regulator [Rhodococcus sp. IEGM 1408]MDV8002360.1 TetR/AcrR family transcriptional regulator [Rhodococcus sp. IEGM 1408]